VSTTINLANEATGRNYSDGEPRDRSVDRLPTEHPPVEAATIYAQRLIVFIAVVLCNLALLAVMLIAEKI
jgi:hypothetical protein